MGRWVVGAAAGVVVAAVAVVEILRFVIADVRHRSIADGAFDHSDVDPGLVPAVHSTMLVIGIVVTLDPVLAVPGKQIQPILLPSLAEHNLGDRKKCNNPTTNELLILEKKIIEFIRDKVYSHNRYSTAHE